MGVFVFNRSKRRLRKALEGCRPRLYRMALAWTRDPDLAKDLAQEVVRRAMKGALQPHDLGQLPLLRMLSACWRERLRRAHPAVPHEEIPLLDGRGLEREAWQRDVSGRVQAEIVRLPVVQRQALTLADIEGLSYADIAEVLGMPVESVPVQLSHARAKLRAALGREISRQRQSNGCCLKMGTAGQGCWWQPAPDRVVRDPSSPVTSG